MKTNLRSRCQLLLLFIGLGRLPAKAQDSTVLNKRFTLHAQETTVSQYRPSFSAKYTGEHSQTTDEQWATTITSTIYSGVRLWKNASFFFNPEISGGSGLSSAFGIAAFTNGEAFRVGNPHPTVYLARCYFRQVFALSNEKELQQDAENKLNGFVPKKYIAFTVGKVSIADYFDDNTFSHNPRNQFLSWGLMSNGAWDYPANTRGYIPSVILEYIDNNWEVRSALSMMPNTANGNIIDVNIKQANALTIEFKYKYTFNKQAGKISGLGFFNSAKMGSYSAENKMLVPDSLNPNSTKEIYSIVASRQYGRHKIGFGINWEQSITDNVGIFARTSYNDGKTETWCFTEIDQAASAGLSIKGTDWRRNNDILGIGFCISGLSPEHRAYIKQGGLGFIIGDGQLNYAAENLFETYYSAALTNNMTASFFYQFIVNPAYNKDRGPINIYSIRIHFSF